MCDAATPQVQAWAGLIQQYASDLPLDFQLNWIGDESCGNPCSMPASTITQLGGEMGIYQLDVDNRATAGVSAEALRAGCLGLTERLDRPLTDDEKLVHVTSGREYINKLRVQTHRALAGLPWDDESNPDFWAMLKMIHTVGPGKSINLIPFATQALGHPPQSWAEWRSAIEPTGAVATKWFNLAEHVGSGGAGFQPSLFSRLNTPTSFMAIAAVGFLAGMLAAAHRLLSPATHR